MEVFYKMKGLFKQYNYSYTQEQYKEIWENGLFVFDTNTLLNLYRYQTVTRDEFLEVLKKISSRIWIPHHVALEFQRNRLIVICEQKELFSKTKKAVEGVQAKLNTEVESLKLKKRHSLIRSDDFVEKFNELIQLFFVNLEDLKSKQTHLSKQDTLQIVLENLFDGKVGDAPKNQDELDKLYKVAELRYKNKIPPGYMDEKKEDISIDKSIIYKKKYGDFLVWEQLLSFTKTKTHKQVIFVSNDAKEDWWLHLHASGEKFSQPRPELLDEAFHKGGIENFLLYDSEGFLKYAKEYLDVEISQSSVQEVIDTNEIYNREVIKSSFHKAKENRSNPFENIVKFLAIESIKDFQSKLKYNLHKNKDTLECPECGNEEMIYNESSSTNYQCTYCGNEELDEIEEECTMCGSTWPRSDLVSVEWSDEGYIEKICPHCNKDPDYVDNE